MFSLLIANTAGRRQQQQNDDTLNAKINDPLLLFFAVACCGCSLHDVLRRVVLLRFRAQNDRRQNCRARIYS